jgi:hypothetical protein
MKKSIRLDIEPQVGAAIEDFVHLHSKFSEFTLTTPELQYLQSARKGGDGVSKSVCFRTVYTSEQCVHCSDAF